MTLSQIYLIKAKKVAERNQYTCNMFKWHQGETLALSRYQNMLGPVWIKRRPRDSRYWWSADLDSTNQENTYAHKARVIALLLAHEMIKTGDIVI